MNSKPVHDDLFIVGDFLVIDPASPLRFDEEITLKEDYDLTEFFAFNFGTRF